MHFQQIEKVPGDPIFGLQELYKNDPASSKMELALGVYKDEHGNTPVLDVVKRAEQHLLEHETSKSYIGSHGDPLFNQLITRLVLGDNNPLLDQRAAATQAPGGTGALRLAAEFIATCLPGRSIWISDPSWPIHQTLFAAAGVEVKHYPYIDSHNQVAVDTLLDTLNRATKGDVVLLHACCHNPSGFDLTDHDWQRVLDVIKSRDLLPLLDFAYQGFGDGLEQDASVVRLFAEQLPELLITHSCSKNFGLYRERTGALLVCAANSDHLQAIRSQLAVAARNLWSTPPSHGAAVVTHILGNDELRRQWTQELETMRQRIVRLRHGLVEALGSYGLAERFEHITRQRGIFSYTGLSIPQVKRLQEEFSIYMVGRGRANITGINSAHIDQLATAIAHVCK
ncbi:amino acid aminotransferase [Ectopseudomonas mendocina]|uniref:Amino acid aminotransferase n=1 Tax=Ectopseudomonas mendocina TaxID=300 RepID=A0ABZ2RLB4_ECTME